MISWYYAQVGLPDEGLRFARRAVDAEPGCWQCLDTLALLLFEKGRPEEALEMQRRALNLLPESFTPDELSARLYHYERAAQDAAPAAKGTTGAER
jgi:tetratricopeptide (TPR) repeat protein